MTIRRAVLLASSLALCQPASAEPFGVAGRWVVTEEVDAPAEGPFSCALTLTASIVDFTIHLLKQEDRIVITVRPAARDDMAAGFAGLDRVTIAFDRDIPRRFSAALTDAGAINVRIPQPESFLELFAASDDMILSAEEAGTVAIDLAGSRAASDLLQRCKNEHTGTGDGADAPGSPAASDDDWTTFTLGDLGIELPEFLANAPQSPVRERGATIGTMFEPDNGVVLSLTARRALGRLPREVLTVSRGDRIEFDRSDADVAAIAGIGDVNGERRGFYRACTLAGSALHCFSLSYPADQKALFQPVAERLAATLR